MENKTHYGFYDQISENKFRTFSVWLPCVNYKLWILLILVRIISFNGPSFFETFCVVIIILPLLQIIASTNSGHLTLFFSVSTSFAKLNDAVSCSIISDEPLRRVPGGLQSKYWTAMAPASLLNIYDGGVCFLLNFFNLPMVSRIWNDEMSSKCYFVYTYMASLSFGAHTLLLSHATGNK